MQNTKNSFRPIFLFPENRKNRSSRDFCRVVHWCFHYRVILIYKLVQNNHRFLFLFYDIIKIYNVQFALRNVSPVAAARFSFKRRCYFVQNKRYRALQHKRSLPNFRHCRTTHSRTKSDVLRTASLVR